MTDYKDLHAVANSHKLLQDKRLRIDIAAIKEITKTNVIQDV